MRKTPSALKWLVDKRARLAADAERLAKLADEVTTRAAQARESLTAIDGAIRVFDARYDPAAIKPVGATKGKYGKHGALRKTVEGALRAAAPAAMGTDELALVLMLELGLDFELPTDRSRWVKNSLSPTLRAMVEDGLVEREHDPTAFTSEVGRWRWAGEGKLPTMKALREQCATVNAAIQSGDVVPLDGLAAKTAANNENKSGRRKTRFRF